LPPTTWSHLGIRLSHISGRPPLFPRTQLADCYRFQMARTLWGRGHPSIEQAFASLLLSPVRAGVVMAQGAQEEDVRLGLFPGVVSGAPMVEKQDTGYSVFCVVIRQTAVLHENQSHPCYPSFRRLRQHCWYPRCTASGYILDGSIANVKRLKPFSPSKARAGCRLQGRGFSR
jgi:hypothetical protein